MNIVFLLVPLALLLSLFFVWCFIWALKKDQFNDLETPAHAILIEETDS